MEQNLSNFKVCNYYRCLFRFFMFLKLTLVMGLSWVFEIVSWAVTDEDSDNHWVWIIIDIYNILSAILIFIIFVCQGNTLNLLQQVIPALNGK